jgi:Na+-transporting methylmalonyl-CoA/oxaloacetate decarboxylase gamma subunit
MEVAVDLRQGLYVTSLGMTLVFVALLVVMAVALVLERLFRAGSGQERESPEPYLDHDAKEEESRVAAVIAVSLAILGQVKEVEAPAVPPDSVLTLKHVPMGWKTAGRIAGMR